MVPQWLFRLVQSALLVVKVVYWQLFVVFLSAAQLFGAKGVQPTLNKVPARVALCVELDKAGAARRKASPKAAQRESEELIAKCALAAVWCFDAGVDDVTMFESSAVLSGGIEMFCKQLEKRLAAPPTFPRLIFGKLRRVRAVSIFENGNRQPSAQVRCASAEEATEQVSIRFLTDEDSDRDLARVAQQLVDETDLQPNGITEKLLNGRLSSSRGNADKLNLILTYSVAPNLLGFPPWLMRTPEILNIGESIIKASYASFVWAMFKYSKTEQRWGR